MVIAQRLLRTIIELKQVKSRSTVERRSLTLSDPASLDRRQRSSSVIRQLLIKKLARLRIRRAKIAMLNSHRFGG